MLKIFCFRSCKNRSLKRERFLYSAGKIVFKAYFISIFCFNGKFLDEFPTIIR